MIKLKLQITSPLLRLLTHQIVQGQLWSLHVSRLCECLGEIFVRCDMRHWNTINCYVRALSVHADVCNTAAALLGSWDVPKWPIGSLMVTRTTSATVGTLGWSEKVRLIRGWRVVCKRVTTLCLEWLYGLSYQRRVRRLVYVATVVVVVIVTVYICVWRLLCCQGWRLIRGWRLIKGRG